MTTVPRVLLPRTDLEVFPVAMGSARMGQKNGEAEAMDLLDTYFEAGGNFIDTARVYYAHDGGEENLSERIIGDWMRSRACRKDVVLLTKGGHHDLTTGAPRLDKTALEADINGSLKSLQCEWIDLYCLHRDDPNMPVEEIIETLQGCKNAGKIRHYGSSSWGAERIDIANEYSASKGYDGFVNDQSMLCLGMMSLEPMGDTVTADHWKIYEKWNMSVTAFTSLARGYFNKVTIGQDASVNLFESPENRGLAEIIGALAVTKEISVTQVMLGYLQSLSGTIVPVVEPRTKDQMIDVLSAVGVRLSDAEIRKLNQAARLNFT